jgi:hypothetical protein
MEYNFEKNEKTSKSSEKMKKSFTKFCNSPSKYPNFAPLTITQIR